MNHQRIAVSTCEKVPDNQFAIKDDDTLYQGYSDNKVEFIIFLHGDNSKEVAQSVCVVRQRWSGKAEVAVILGTGLGAFVESLEIEQSFYYEELPGFCLTTAIGHAGEFLCGRVDGIPVIVLRGRSHRYEGVTREQVAFPVRVLHQLGIRRLIVSCAAGGLSPRFRAGELMLIEDHLDLLSPRSPHQNGGRNSQAREFYDKQMRSMFLEIARRQNVVMHSGTYVSVTGPNYETRAEMRFYRRFADAIGMSIIPEVQLADQLGMQVSGLATITNLCNPDAFTVADGDHVVSVAAQTEPVFRRLVLEFIRTIQKS